MDVEHTLLKHWDSVGNLESEEKEIFRLLNASSQMRLLIVHFN